MDPIGPKGSATNISVPYTTGHHQRSHVYSQTDQNCFLAQEGTYTVGGFNVVADWLYTCMQLLCIYFIIVNLFYYEQLVNIWNAFSLFTPHLYCVDSVHSLHILQISLYYVLFPLHQI